VWESSEVVSVACLLPLLSVALAMKSPSMKSTILQAKSALQSHALQTARDGFTNGALI
jgi:hypothetical protein